MMGLLATTVKELGGKVIGVYNYSSFRQRKTFRYSR